MTPLRAIDDTGKRRKVRPATEARPRPDATATRLSLLATTLLAVVAIRSVAAEFTPEQVEFFERKVRPVLVDRCFSCHSAESKKLKGDLRLDSREAVLKGGESGKPGLRPGDPEHSLLIEAVRYGNQELQMPPKGRLPEEAIADLTEWVKMGAPWPAGDAKAAEAKKESFNLEKRRAGHWAWSPVVRPPLPAVRDAGWPRQPVDRFLLARLEKEGLKPTSAASRATLIRRLYFDLIGLPPSPEAIAAFESDNSPDALDRVVRELLSSPRFGERWARHWLDLVRYAETLAHEFDYPRQNAWRYRDYVIRALNGDLPYDQFAREHLAGDLLANPRRDPSTGINESIIGTAFWWFGQQVHSPVDIRVHQSDVIDNQIDVASKTFLGLTVACARCHDHKFDAISTRDFYALYGMLSSSRYGQRSIDPADSNAATIRQLAGIRPQLRTELAAEWLAGLESVPRQIAERATNPAIVRLRATHPVTGDTGSQGAPAGSPVAPSVTIGDFSKGLPADWFVDGEAFANAAVQPGELVPLPTGLGDGRLATEPGVHSAKYTKRLQGALRSPTFVLTNRYLHVRCAGRDSRFNVVVAGFTMIQAPIYGDLRRVLEFDEPRWVTIDTRMWSGQRAFIEFNDLSPADPAGGGRGGGYGPNGWVFVHQVALSDQPEPPGGNRPAPKASDEPIAEWSARVQQRARATIEAWRKAGPGEAVVDRAGLQLVNALLAEGLLKPASGSASVQKQRELEAAVREPQFVPAMVDGSGLDENVFIRGSARTPGEPVQRRFLEALGGESHPFGKGSGRLEFAEQVLDPSNPLPARVMVNRVWLHLFGRGIVPTPDDFGVLGQPPSHPELLDWLADWFRTDAHWSVKQLIAMLVKSQAYAMAAIDTDPAASEKDPENILLHRMPVRRLEGEIIRDSLLALSGRLDPTMYGPSVPTHLTDFMDGRGRPGSSGPADGAGRRSIYLEVRNNFLSPMMRTFDTPVPFTTVGRRTVSNVPAQSLILMNDPFVQEQARLWAERVLAAVAGTESRISRLYQLAFGRPPTAAEIGVARDFIATQASALGIAGDAQLQDPRPWADLGHALVNVKEFIYLH